MNRALPQHDVLSFTTRAIEAGSIVAACGLLLVHAARLWQARADLAWWMAALVPAGMLLADFVSGVVHWSADTWGSETMPVLGPRFLRPFRVHHVNPDDFLRRGFIDCNGDVASLVSVLLLAGFLLTPGAAALFFVSFCAAALPTNQVHQWAHMPHPPRFVRRLQRWNILLSREDHQRHHAAPYVMNYCIANGWCNRILVAIGFFPAVEFVITKATGRRPRSNDQDFAGLFFPEETTSTIR